VLPAMLASGLLAFFFDWAPHAPHARRGRYVDTRVMPSPALTWLMVFQNYHLIHHLYPRVPFYRYGALFREIAGELAAAGAPIGTWPAPRPTDRRGTGTPR
jgi:beta-carotene hydroxylase